MCGSGHHTRSGDPQASERRRKLQLARESYLEVLDATKHQDDKIGRYLTALAFLTTGAITLLFRGDLLRVMFEFKGQQMIWEGSYPLVAWLTALFFICILGSVIMLLLSLSSPLRIPGRKTEWGPDLGGSRLFYAYIGSQRVTSWRSRWLEKESREIEEELLKQYVLETHNLAERARTKYRHTNEASTLFVLALYFLAFAVMLSIRTAADGGVRTPHVVLYGVGTSTALGVIGALFAVVQIYVRFSHDKRSFDLVYESARLGEDSDAGKTEKAASSIRWLLLTVPTFVLAHALAWDGVLERRAGFLVATACVVLSFVLTKSRWRDATRRSFLTKVALFGVGPVVFSALSFAFGGVGQLGMTVAPGAFFSGWALLEIIRREGDLVSKKRVQGRAGI